MDNQKLLALISKFLNGNCSASEEKELTEWMMHDEGVGSWWEEQIGKSPDMMTEKQKQDVLRRINAEIGSRSEKSSVAGPSVRRRRFSRLWRWVAAAAIIALPLLSAWVTYRVLDDSPRQFVVRANRGSQTAVVLPDGSEVMLQASSVLTYDSRYGRGSRDVRLAGKALFDIQRDPSHPFRVNSESMDITVLGTRFSVENYTSEDLVRVVLSRGSVRLDAEDMNLTMRPNECVQYSKKSKTFTKKNVNAEDYFGWSIGMLYFDNQSFVDIMRELEHVYNIHIQYAPKQWSGERFTGNLPARDFRAALDVLGKAGTFKYTVDDSTVYIVKE